MPRRLTTLVALGLVLGMLGTPVARADGDPASDWLYTQWVFYPFYVKFDSGLKQGLTSTVQEARKRGYPIKVALITQRYDLGAIPELFGQPQRYARFLGAELSFLYHGRLLIVMPNGLGLSRNAKADPSELKLLAGLKPARGDNAMVATATRAVRRLAASKGIRLPAVKLQAASSSSHGSTGNDRLVIAYAAVGAVLLLAAGWFVRHRRLTGHWL